MERWGAPSSTRHGAALAPDAPRGNGWVLRALRLLRAIFLFTVDLVLDLSVPDAQFMAALVVLAIASISFSDGMMTSVLPLDLAERGPSRLDRPGTLLVVSVSTTRRGASDLEQCSPRSRLRRTRSTVAGRDPRPARACRRWGRIWPLLVTASSRSPAVDLLAGREVREEARKVKRSGE